MAKIANIKVLLLNELKFEFKNKQNIGSIGLFVIASTFLAYLAIKVIDSAIIWNSIFWIILLFAAINSTMNSFKKSKEQYTYLYSLVSPQELIISKILYNSLIVVTVTLLCLLSYSMFLGSYIGDIPLFICVAVTGSFSLACILTLAGGISYKASGTSALFGVLSIPILIPVLVLLIAASIGALKNTHHQSFLNAEMYAGKEFNIKCTLLSKQNSYFLFIDQEDKERLIKLEEGNQLTVGSSYIISGTYEAENNFYEISRVALSNKKGTFGSWIKTATVFLISLLLMTISYLIFPKFWKE